QTLAIEFAEGHITAAQLRRATEHLRRRLDDVEALRAESARVGALAALLKEADVASAWGALEEEKRRAIIASLATIVLYPVGRGRTKFDPSTVGVEWKSSADGGFSLASRTGPVQALDNVPAICMRSRAR